MVAPSLAQGSPPGGDVILEVEHLSQRYKIPGATLEAVSNVSFTIYKGQTLGLVGESGSGKSSIGRAIVQLPPPTVGSVKFAGIELTTMPQLELRAIRQRLQMIYQDPISALNPRRSIRDVVGQGLTIAGQAKKEVAEKVDTMLELVGLEPPVFGDRRAHQLSGGQCQRVAIARALIVEPELLVCDEPVASLDVSVQGQILNLLEELRSRYGLSMLFISHDLSVVHVVSDHIGVVYLGKIVEIGSSVQVTQEPAHPYTRGLLDAVPIPDPEAPLPKAELKGEIPSPLSPPSGCRFRTRCPRAQERCAVEVPHLRDLSSGQRVACHFPLHGESAPPRSESTSVDRMRC